MIDWFVLLTPLLVLLLVLPTVYLGCADIAGLEQGTLRTIILLAFDRAVLPEDDPAPSEGHHVSLAPVISISVHWVLRADESDPNPPSVVQTKGPPLLSPFVPFRLSASGLADVFPIKRIGCWCQVEAGGQVRTAEVSVAYEAGKTFMFRLKRAAVARPFPMQTPPAFYVIVDSETD